MIQSQELTSPDVLGEDVTRGLVDRLDPCVVRDAEGREVWNGEVWTFLADAATCEGLVEESLRVHAAQTAHHGLFRVDEGVYQIRGLDLANMTILETADGLVVIDPLTSTETSAAALALYRRNRGERPVVAVIYTHSHSDHFGGVLGVVTRDEVASGAVRVIAPEGFTESALDENVMLGPAMRRRGLYQFGHHLAAAPEGTVGSGIGQGVPTGSRSFLAPTEEISRTGEIVEIGGCRIEFHLAPETEAPAEMNIHLPDTKVLLVAEMATQTMHNILTLRGAVVRDARRWADFLDELVLLYPDVDVMIGSHHWPVWGGEEVRRHLMDQRDAYGFLHDQTVRLMNRGMTPAAIAEALTSLPGPLGEVDAVRGFYGSMNHNVKAVYQRYFGWFDGNPASLWPLPRLERGRRYLELAGGPERLLERARVSLAEGELRWAAELLDHLLAVDPGSEQGRALQADVFEALGRGAQNSIWRNYYLSGALELRTPQGLGPKAPSVTPAVAAGLTVAQVVELLRTRVDGFRACQGPDHTLAWVVDGVEIVTCLRKGVLNGYPGGSAPDAPSATVVLARSDLDLLVLDPALFRARVDAGDIRVSADGGRLLRAFVDCLEMPPNDGGLALPPDRWEG